MQTDWLTAFEQAHGRPLRVLHIGNIANNAYINAKIQRRIGIEADVCCYDYFHIMGCPEWEDADFEGDVRDQFFPDWWAVDLHGFSRPRWFAQGRQRTCIRYLLALRRGDERLERLLWRQLRFELWLRCRSTRGARFVAALVGVVRGSIPQRPGLPQQPVSSGAESWLEWIELFLLWLIRLVAYAVAWVNWRARVTVLRRIRIGVARTSTVTRVAARKTIALGRAATAVAAGQGWRTAALMVFPRRLSRVARTDAHQAMVQAAWLASGQAQSNTAQEDENDPVVALYARLFGPNSTLSTADYGPYLSSIPTWSHLVNEYDVVQGYALDPVIPLLVGKEAYAAYEHGTLRDLPFEDSARGRLCALSYRAAPVVFVTNSDVLPSARRLGLTAEQTVSLPHAVDSERLLRFAAEHGELRPGVGDDVVIVSPTRHDWFDADPLWAKGNDRLIRALAAVRDAGRTFRVVLFEWGRHVEQSKHLIDELELGELVTWSPTLRKRELWRQYMTAHAVVDQFLTPAMGSVAFESLALGCRVITALDVATVEEFFGEMPPVLNASEQSEITAALLRVIDDPLDATGIGKSSQDWFRRRHSTERILELELAAYARLVGSR